MATVANISNEGSKTFISTDYTNPEEEGEDEAEEEDQVKVEDEDKMNTQLSMRTIQIEANEPTEPPPSSSVKKGDDGFFYGDKGKLDIKHLPIPSNDSEEKLMASSRTSASKNFMQDSSKIYRPIKHDPSSDFIVQNNIRLLSKSDMNDIFVPIKCTKEEI